jgi:hypothetical protein
MIRIIAGSVVGAIVLFAWGWLAWGVLDLHKAVESVPNEAAVVAELKSIDRSGTYYFPGMSEDADEATQEAWAARHKQGPVGFLVYRAEGCEPMDAMMMVKGFALSFVAALVAAIVLAASALKLYLARVFVVALMGVFVAVSADLAYWNWMYFHTDYTIGMVIDHVVGAALLGVAVGAIVRPAKWTKTG